MFNGHLLMGMMPLIASKGKTQATQIGMQKLLFMKWVGRFQAYMNFIHIQTLQVIEG